MNGYAAQPVNGFGLGLNLRDGVDAVEVGAAIDALNVRFSDRGVVQARGGYQAVGDLSGDEVLHSLLAVLETSSGLEHLVACRDFRLEAMSAIGGAVASFTDGVGAGDWSGARLGQPTQERLWLANGASGLISYNGVEFSRPTHTYVERSGITPVESAGVTGPNPRCVVVTADNRLLAVGCRAGQTTAGPNGQASDVSRVWASEPGDPLKWNSDEYFSLHPGDGDELMGAITWRELTFLFKRRKFWVYTGSSADNEGGPVFHRRLVDTGIGLVAPSAVCAGRDGVYFIGEKGVYRTTGGDPELLSALVEPVFLGGASDYFRGGVLSAALRDRCSIHWHDELLYVSYPSQFASLPDRQLVLDPRYGWWSLYDLPAHAMATVRRGLHFAGQPAGKTAAVWRYGDTVSGDAITAADPSGDAYQTRWRSGWFDYGDPAVKTLRETKVWGSGAPTLSLSRDFELGYEREQELDFYGALDTWGDGSGSDTWGDGTGTDRWAAGLQVKPKLMRKAIRGTVFSFALGGLVGAGAPRWSVHRLTHHLLGMDPASALQRDI